MVLKDNHFLLMPSFHENYGHAIAESLLNLCPIIISDHTPWKNLSSHNIGWDIALEDVAGFTNAINTAAQMNELNYRMMQQACAQFANDVICDEKLNQEMLILLNGKA
jgi:glycosyltransferase involved in cell wall biosynthesis